MEKDLKRCVLLSKLLQSQVNMLEKHVLELKTNNMFLITQLRELQWDADRQVKPDEKQNRKTDKDSQIQQNDDTKNQLDSLHKQVQELEARNVFLCEKLTEFEWDEETENQIQYSMLLNRRERALTKLKLQYESEKDMINDDVESSDQSGEDYGCDEIDC